MPNIASALKAEMSRIARKELRSEISSLKATLSSSRTQIADLKRRVQSLEQQVRRVGKSRAPAAVAEDEVPSHLRFSAKGLASQRRRLGLSAEDFGRLLGVTGQSIYKWEDGRARPRAKYLPAIAHLRTIGKRQVTVALETLAVAA